MTPIADMVERMLRDGVSHDAIVLAVRTAESVTRDVTGDVTVTSQPPSPGAIRTRRWRDNRKQNKTLAEANDAAMPSKETVTRDVTDRHTVTPTCELSSFLPSVSGHQEEEKKKEVTTRARGTRLTADAQLSPEDRQFAIDHNVSNPDQAWAEFIDYWIGVPGQRGTKLNWSATWRNRVRQIGGGNGPGRSRAFQDDSRSVSKAAERLQERIEREGITAFPPRPTLLPRESQSDFQLLPPRRGTGS